MYVTKVSPRPCPSAVLAVLSGWPCAGWNLYRLFCLAVALAGNFDPDFVQQANLPNKILGKSCYALFHGGVF